MADKLGLGPEVRELKLGPSFSNKGTAFHTIRYDFKPASVDVNKMATVAMGNMGSVTVTVPHLDGAGTPHTIFKGSRRPYAKECVLIIDRNTGEITLEKLSYNIQVKKTRMENAHKLAPPAPGLDSNSGGGSGGKRSPHQKGGVAPSSHHFGPMPPLTVPRHSPLHASPSRRSPPSSSASLSSVPPSRSPPPNKRMSPSHNNIPALSTAASLSPANQKSPSLASLPIIGLDEPMPVSQEMPVENDMDTAKEDVPSVGVLSDSSSDSNSSSESGSSDSESDTEHSRLLSMPLNGHVNGMTRMCSPLPGTNPNSNMSTSNSMQQHEHILTEDLQLSETSDSD